MFDLRYHVASLAAVFLALVLGIAVGAAVTEPGLADRSERENLRRQVARLESRLEDAELRAAQSEAARVFSAAAYSALMHDRLARRRILLVSVGPVDDPLDEAAEAIRDAGGTVARMRALELPPDPEPIQRALSGRTALRGYVGATDLDDAGRDFARELVDGGETPLADAFSDVLVRQRDRGSYTGPVDAVVVARTAEPQRGALARFLTGFYEGLAGSGPAVGVELSAQSPSAVPAFDRADLSTVNTIDTVPGKLSLAVLLAGGPEGNYGFVDGDLVIPRIEPVEPAPDRGG